MLLKDIKVIFHKELNPIYPKEEIDSFFYLFMEHYLGLERFALVLNPDLILTKDEDQPFFEGLSRLKLEEPAQYIIGQTSFMDLTIKVDRHVLIPRPETEELVRWVISEFTHCEKEIKILDIGTGSGCIAIALAKNLPNAKIYATDISVEALAVAQENAKLNGVEIYFFQEDIVNPETYAQVNTLCNFDCIISNPPYVRELEKVEMHKNVKAYEPQLALYVPDDDALKFYKAITSLAVDKLKPTGKLFFEINQYLAEETQRLLVDNQFDAVELRKDIFGNFRMLKGVRN